MIGLQKQVLEQPIAPGQHQPVVAEILAERERKKAELDMLRSAATANPFHKHILEYVAELPEAAAVAA